MTKYTVKRGSTILNRLIIPMIFVLLLQISATVFIFFNLNITKRARENAFEMLNEKLTSRYLHIENEMINRWSSVSSSYESFIEIIEKNLSKEHIHFDDTKKFPEIQNDILNESVPELIYLLRKNLVTGVFLVLDIPYEETDGIYVKYPGLYLRNPDPITFSSKNTDILVEHGYASILRTHNLAMDYSWTPYFKLHKNSNSGYDNFFYAPIKAARNATGSDSAELFSYWGVEVSKNSNKTKLITYSLPLLNKFGKIYGVLGVEINEKYIKSILNFKDSLLSGKEIYSFVELENTNNNLKFEIILSDTDKKLFSIFDDDFKYFFAEDGGYPNIYKVKSDSSFSATPKGYVAIRYFDLYSRNTMYENKKWALAGIISSDELFKFEHDLKKLLFQSMLVSCILFLTGIYLSSNQISKILNSVVQGLALSDMTKPLKLDKVNIIEVDILIDAVENLSRELFLSASRVSRIIKKMEVPIGVFEHNNTLGTVFCNSVWFKLFNIENYNEDKILDETEFYELLKSLDDYIYSITENQTIYVIPTGVPGQVRWIGFTKLKEDKHILGVASDITKDIEEKKSFEFQMNYDSLTGLYKKNAFDEKISSIFENCEIDICALIIWDLDNLKYVNDSFGHSCGDMYLQHFAKLLYFLRRERCIVCRISGDEFYSFFYGYSSIEEIRNIVNSFWLKLQDETFILPNGKDVKLRVSAGLAWYPDDAADFFELVKYADFALYYVKHAFKGTLYEFNREIYDKNYVLIQGTENFNKLIDNRLVKYAMQPIVDARKGVVYGYEMLMRSDIPEFKNPADILRLARVQSKLYSIEEISMFESMKTFVSKVESGQIQSDSKVFINTISSQTMPKRLFEIFENKYEAYLSNIVMEVTETDPLNTSNFAQKLSYVKKWNAMIAIDDFGTGYNSDSSLIFLTPNLVKVDMSIVRDIHKSVDKQNVLENLISYAKKRGIIVLAEGVENFDEIKVLASFGVDLFQGYFFGKPEFDIEPVSENRLKQVKELYI